MLDLSDVTVTCTKLSPRKIAANRANAKKSTGPRTEAGKRASSRNAFKIGAFAATDAVLIGEHQGQYNQHRINMLCDLNPSNHLQLRVAGLIIAASWNLDRIGLAERQEHFWTVSDRRKKHEQKCRRASRRRQREDLPEQDDPKFARPKEWVQLIDILANNDGPAMRYERLQKLRVQLEMSFHRNINQLRKLKKDAKDGPEQSELTKKMLAEWEAEGKEIEQADREAAARKKAAKAAKSEAPEADILPDAARDKEKSKTNPPIPEAPARPEVSDAETRDDSPVAAPACVPAQPNLAEATFMSARSDALIDRSNANGRGLDVG